MERARAPTTPGVPRLAFVPQPVTSGELQLFPLSSWLGVTPPAIEWMGTDGLSEEEEGKEVHDILLSTNGRAIQEGRNNANVTTVNPLTLAQSTAGSIQISTIDHQPSTIDDRKDGTFTILGNSIRPRHSRVRVLPNELHNIQHPIAVSSRNPRPKHSPGCCRGRQPRQKPERANRRPVRRTLVPMQLADRGRRVGGHVERESACAIQSAHAAG